MKQFVAIMLLALCLFDGCNKKNVQRQSADSSDSGSLAEMSTNGGQSNVHDLFGSWRLASYTDGNGTFTAENWGNYIYCEISIYTTEIADYKIDDWHGFGEEEIDLEVRRVEGALPAYGIPGLEGQAWHVELRNESGALVMKAALYGDRLYSVKINNSGNESFPYAFTGVYERLGIDRQYDWHEWDEWIGEYAFYELTPPDDHSGYHISIYKVNDWLESNIQIDGFDAMAKRRTQIVGNPNYVEVVFAEYIWDEAGLFFDMGDLMLTLTKRDGELYTAWGKMQPILGGNATPGVYFHKAGSLRTSPDFLSSEQRVVYEKAMKLYEEYFALGTGGRTVLQESITINDMTYQRMGGEYTRWDDFMAILRNLFTEEWMAGVENGMGYIESNGNTYFLGADRGSNYYYVGPDLYALVSENEERVIFQIIGQYDYEYGEGIVQEAYPVELVRTSAGWRVNYISVTY